MSKKHAFLLFTKVPVPGLTKTRLTIEQGGILTPEQATELYTACMLDVASIAFKALTKLNKQALQAHNHPHAGHGHGHGHGHSHGNCNGSCQSDSGPANQYDFVVCCSPASEQPLLEKIFEEAGPWPGEIQFINDRGETFDEHFDNAFQQLFEQGYHSVVSIGGDLPTMPFSHIVQAFEWLAYFDKISARGGFVQAPCQACGVSLVGYTKDTPMDSEGVFYNLNGIPALDAYTIKAQQRSVPVILLDTVADVDNLEDLAHTISLMNAIAYSSKYQRELVVPKRTLDWVNEMGIVVSTPPNTQHDPRECIDA